jgi:thiol-disulfide isomerase/thioredoxin
MRITRTKLCLLTLLGTLAGCSQTGGVRPGASSNMRTVASVGDKPLPIVAGEPGSSLRAETDVLDLPGSTGARISGRVYDDRGKPVPNAKVRLAVSSSPGGKVVYDTTDRSGGFTLRGLRAGLSYTVIAEYQGEDGIVTGRVQAKAPEGDVRISLKPHGETGQGHASIRPARPRVEPISNVDPVEDDPPVDSRPGAAPINSEDLELPAPEAASLPARRNVQLSRATADNSAAPVRAGWNPRQTGTANAAPATASTRDQSNNSATISQSSAAVESTPEADDDGPNPLPPAFEPGAAGSKHSAVRPDDDPVRVARAGTGTARRRSRPQDTATLERDDSRSIGIMDPPGEREPGSMPEELVPGGRLITPGSSGPISVDEPPDVRTPADSSASRAQHPASPIAVQATNVNSPEPTGSKDSMVARTASPKKRPTWRELEGNQPEVPVDESVRRTTTGDAEQPRDHAIVTLTSSTTRDARPAIARLLGGTRPLVDPAIQKAVCRFDPSERRLVDFQLPNLDGQMVSLHDLSADVILLDFWGSWCEPCRTSIPHLAELQAKMGGKRLQVIGVACEKGSTLQDRRAAAAKASKELGINYPILLTTKDGDCPVQKALQVQFYPTLVLLDRDGRLLAREHGATEITLARMDRAIAAALRGTTGDRIID